ncbi:MAG: hypothetical protein ACRDLM_07860 [Gaiellaceae bacterium]
MKLLLFLLIALGILPAPAPSGPRVTIGPFVAPIHPTSPTSLRFSTASNRQFARHDVQVLLRIVQLPSSARQVAKLPKDVPAWPGVPPGSASAHRLWIVHEPLKKVVAYVQANARPRPRPEVPFRSKTNGVAFRATGQYEFPPTPGRSTSRWLYVAMTPLPGRATAVVAQAGDQWLHVSPRSAVLPTKVRRIDIRSSYGGRRANVLVHVHDRFEVARIVAWVNGLGVASSRVICLDQFVGGPGVTLTFRSAAGTVLARAEVSDPGGSGESGPCNPLQLTVGGRKAVPLIGADLLRRIQQDLQVDLAPPTTRVVTSCLRSHDFTTNMAKDGITARQGGSRWTITFHATGKVTANRAAPHALARCLRGRPPIVILG